MLTYDKLILETIESQPIVPKNLPAHCLGVWACYIWNLIKNISFEKWTSEQLGRESLVILQLPT